MSETTTKSQLRQQKSASLSKNQQLVYTVRLTLGETQVEMADRLQISASYLSMIERGVKEPSSRLVATVTRIAQDTAQSASSPRALLKSAREAKEMSQKDLAKATGYGVGYIQALEDTGARISEKFAEKAATVLGIEKEDLMGGSDQVPVIGIGLGTMGATPNVKTTDGIKARNIPLISMAQAGELVDHTDQIYDYEAITAYDVRDPKAIAVRIKGDSMSPEFPEGSVAVVCPSYEAHTGDYVIARLKEGGVVFKKLERVGTKLRFISSNPAYEMFAVDAAEVAWCYPVDQVIRKMR